ncbi:hypothetical protein V1507DRAFT_459482 [Lipomyces tetrasporus]
MAERTSRSPTPGTYPRLLEDDALLASTGSTTPRTHNSIPTARGSKSVLHRPRKRRSLGAFDILKRSHSDLIDRDNLGKLHSSSFHRIKEVAQSLSEEEKAALKESAVDPAVAMSHLYASMLVQMERADEISSEVPIERLFILKRGKTLYYHGTVAAKRLLDLQHEEYVNGNSNNIFMQLQSYLMLKEAVCPMKITLAVLLTYYFNSFCVGASYIFQWSPA